VYSLNGTKRVYVTPTNPQTASQSVVRGAFSFLTSAWAGLTETERKAWRAAWSSGDWVVQDPVSGTSRRYGSAKSLFIALNTNILVGTNALGTPVVALAVPVAKSAPAAISITSFIFDVSAGDALVVYTGTQNNALVVRATPPVSAGNLLETSVKSKLRTLTGSLGTTPANVGTEFIAINGPYAGHVGEKVFYTIEQIDTISGNRSFVASGSTIIAA
jgi:hypothetical protein